MFLTTYFEEFIYLDEFSELPTDNHRWQVEEVTCFVHRKTGIANIAVWTVSAKFRRLKCKMVAVSTNAVESHSGRK